MHEYFNVIMKWYEAHLNYATITLFMAVESSFVPLPSELIIPPAAYLAFQGKLSLGWVIFFSTVGCIIGALFNYVLSFYLGRKIIYGIADSKLARIFFINRQKVEHAERYFLQNGNVSTLIGRLIPGVRHLISIPAGLSQMNLKKFVLFTCIGSAIWNATLAIVSYMLVDKWDVYFKEITWSFVGAGLVFVGYLVFKALKKR